MGGLAGDLGCILARVPARIVRAGILSTALFVLIYATTPPQHWGEVTQALLYHQVRTTDPTFWC